MLVLLNEFEQYHINKGNPLEIFKENLNYFRKKWVTFTTETSGFKIEGNKMIQFLISLDELLC